MPSEPQVTIGVLDGPREYELFDVSAAARQSDGDFVVVDGGAREVRLYDRHGTFVRRLGGPGSGPGEFEKPTGVLVTAADSGSMLLIVVSLRFNLLMASPACFWRCAGVGKPS